MNEQATGAQGGLRLIRQPLLADRTSIRLGGEAIAELRAMTRPGLEQAAKVAQTLGGRAMVLGRGSNILAADGPLPLVLVSLESSEEPRLVGEENGALLLHCHGGLKLSSLLAKAASLNLTGLEGLAGIPGSVGGAVAMNAGSFGVEIGSLVHEVEVFSPAGGFMTLQAGDVEFGYRRCRFLPFKEQAQQAGEESAQHARNWALVYGVTLALRKSDEESVRRAMREVQRKKKQSQPIEAWSAGSTFKNPAPDAPAGLLLERAGMKGCGTGGMYFSEKHANFLVNTGNGTCAQALELIELARTRVKAMSGHSLELEVRLWP